ncbi:NAD(+) diphosphatase [Pelotomaculum propionicicum]|uniref:NAD(+) diphosphatase n=1 Tax=Pelotomaculum propionicicum TaxID=258475 RepID=UPI003B7C5B00
MVFVPEFTPKFENDGLAHWFVFHRGAMLVRLCEDKAITPFSAESPVPETDMSRRIYLGQLDGTPCYAIEALNDCCEAPDKVFLGLRKLFGLIGDGFYQAAARAVQLLHWDHTHQYCGRCGARTETNSGEHAKSCPACGLVSYPRISPAVICAITSGNQILLARRTSMDYFSVIAGFVEPGETLEVCLRREIREEVGVEIKNIKYFGSQSWPFPHSLMVAFTAEYAGGEIAVDGTEIEEAAWFTAKDLPPMPPPVSIARRLVNWFVEKNRGHSPAV